MSLTFIAMTGILVGFLCLVIGFFMEDSHEPRSTEIVHPKRTVKAAKKKMLVPTRKAA